MGTLRQDANIFINNSMVSENTGSCNVLLESVRCVGMKGSTIENNSGIGMCVHYIGGGCSWQDPIWNLTGCVEDCGPIPFNFDSVGMPSNLPAGQLLVLVLKAMFSKSCFELQAHHHCNYSQYAPCSDHCGSYAALLPDTTCTCQPLPILCMGAEIQNFANFSQYGSFTTLYSNASGSGNGTNWSGDLSGVYQAAQALCMDIRTSTFRNNTVLTENVPVNLNCNSCCTILHPKGSAIAKDSQLRTC